ncbi:MAG: hypothetical protein H7Y03_13460, partial [Chitinophagaceae bacterium]|nr:hypothetical protein [Chitinophagaceae bacterium]
MQKNIVFLGATDNYPMKFCAENSKNELIARGLKENGNDAVFINSPIGLKGNDSFLTGEKYGITYYIFSHVQKSKPFDLFKNLRLIYGILKEKKKSGGKNILITEHSYFPLF